MKQLKPMKSTKLMKQVKPLKLISQWHRIVVALLIISLLMTPSKAVADGQTVNNLSDLQTVIQVDLTNRETNFTLYYTGDTAQMVDNLQTVFKRAKEANDYLNTSLTSWEYQVSGTTKKASIEFTVGYLTTKAQEDYIDATIETLMPRLISSDMSDITKEKAIHDWLINNVAYDYTLKQRTAYTALSAGKTVCTGYAMLMNKMLNHVGIKNYIIAGHLSETGSSIPTTELENHVWNLVQIDNQWYHVDATNDWNNPDSLMFFNKGSAFMREKGFSWSEDQLIRPVEPMIPVTKPSTDVNPPKLPNIDQLSEGILPYIQSVDFTKFRGYLDNLVAEMEEWMSSMAEQLSSLKAQLEKKINSLKDNFKEGEINIMEKVYHIGLMNHAKKD